MHIPRILPAAFGAVFLAGAANAASITEFIGFSFVPNDTKTLTFDQFDPNGGELGVRTLTSIVLSWQVAKTGGSLYVDNDSATPGSGNITQSVIIDLESTDVSLNKLGGGTVGQNITATTSYNVSVGADDGDGVGFQAGGVDYGGTVFGTSANTLGSGTVATDSYESGLTGYLGTGTYSVDVTGIQTNNTAVIGGAAFQGTPSTAYGHFRVTYNYTAIPEPSTALLGAFGALALLRRRRA